MDAIQERDAAPEAASAVTAAPANKSRFGARFALGLLLPIALLIAWEAAVAYGYVQARLMPPPSRIFKTLYDLAITGELWRHIGATLARVAAGFALGTIAGTLVGAIAGASRISKDIVDPTLQGFRSVPSIAWVPLFILWLGIFEQSKIALIAVGCFFPVYLGVLGAISSVDRKTVEVGRIFRLSQVQLVCRILLPAILPAYILSLRQGLGLGWMFVVAAEFMGA
jgi:sulfonate transport system permease protein